ncbi:MAG: endonuclease/exonuclease/phosphatase family protein [Pseudomonadota bacterium]
MLLTILKALGLIFVLLLTVVGCQTYRNSGTTDLQPNTPDTLRMATYNVHYIILGRETGPWSVGDWERRKGPMDMAFKAVDADVMAFQEMESFDWGSDRQVNLTLDWLLKNNPDYAAAAVGDPAEFPSTQPILYKTEKLRQTDQGWFFFSETPDVIYSRTFNGSFPAFASWAEFEDVATGTLFKVVNIHTDYASLSNRIQSVELVARRITPWIDAGETVFVVGDLNGRIGDRVVDILAETGLSFAPVQGSTFHFNRGINLFGAIDHIASIGDASLVGDPVVLRRQFDGEWPTDHYPVIADYRLGPR